MDTVDGAAQLTERQVRILQCMADGLRAQGICAEMGIARSTLLAHMRLARFKLGARDTTHAVALAMKAGLVR